MNHVNQRTLSSAIFILMIVSLGKLSAEGTRELSPTAMDSVMLHTNAPGFGNFASFTSDSMHRLYVSIENFATEKLYIGLSAEHNDFGQMDAGAASYMFQIRAPDGTIVFGPITIGAANDNATTWLQASSGPDVLDPVNGYDTDATLYPYAMFMPMMNGDYSMEFFDAGTIANIMWYDFTVVSGGTTEEPGRLWSHNWALRSPPRNPNQLPECQFDRSFEGVFYSYTEDGFVSRIDFENSGFQGLSFTVAFGDSGPGNTGDVMADRRSVNDMNATANAADHKVFLNDPDLSLYPSNISQCGSVSLLSVTCEAADSFCINVGVTEAGQVEIILDFNQNGIYDMNTEDVIIVDIFAEADTACFPWNGLKGDGTPIEFGEDIPTIIKYFQGVQHYSAFDVEFLKFGFCVQTIRPICSGIATDLLYWDDSQITDDVVTVTIDEGDPGTGQPKVQFNGCQCGTGGCRTWDTFQIGDPPSSDCTGTPYGYGENSTLNTWWFASTIIVDGIFLPFAQVSISGDSAICEGTTTSFFANVFPDTIDYDFIWSGPGGFTSMNQSTGPVGLEGTYYVTITDPNTDCNAIDSVFLIVFDNPTTSITFTCLGVNQQNANVNLTVTGGQPPYTFLWSTGATTEDLMNVPPGEYFVTVTDANGCQAIDSITVQGCCELIITCPPSNGGTFQCVANVPPASMSGIVVIEFCGDVTISSSEFNNEGSGCANSPLIITRTFTVTDQAGNSQTCVVSYTIIDTIAAITCPANATVQCASLVPPPNPGAIGTSDNCGGTTTVTFIGDVTTNQTCVNRFTLTRTYQAQDACGNTATCNQTITVFDNTAPSITCPAPVTVQCANLVPAPNVVGIVASDNCGGTPTVTFVNDATVNIICANRFTVNRTYQAIDACGNTANCTQAITVFDNTVPSITCPANVTVQCANLVPPVNTASVTTSDNCGGTPIVTFVSDVTTNQICANQLTVTRTYQSTDACNNTATCTQIITVFDNTVPVITCPTNVTVQCASLVPPVNTAAVVTSDNCGGTATVTLVSDITTNQTCVNRLTLTRTYRATDLCGNSATCSQIITVFDNTLPTITCPTNITVACNNQVPPPNTAAVTASDNCGGSVVVTFAGDVITNITCANSFTLTRTYLATDACGNSASCTQTITVSDLAAPTLTCPPNVTVQCASLVPAPAPGSVIASDNCGGQTPVVSFVSDVTTNQTCANRFTITRTYSATDICNNTATCTQIITVFDDTVPSITCPAGVSVQCASLVPPVNTASVTSSDNCGGTPTVTFVSDVTTNQTCANRLTLTRTYRATDACGNSATCAQVITVFDNTAPTITCPADVTVQCANLVPAATPGTIATSDNCGGTATVTFADVTTNQTCVSRFTLTRTYTATDVCGNSATCNQIITVFDNTVPVITCPANVTVSCAANVPAVNTAAVIFTDNCGSATVTHLGDVTTGQTCPNNFIVTRTYRADDQCGNSATCTQTITVADLTPPTAICNDFNIDFGSGSSVTLTPEDLDNGSTDNCGTVTLAISQSEFTCNQFVGVSSIPVTLTVTDQCGNSSTCIANVTGIGGILEIDCPADITVNLGPGECTAFVHYVVEASSLCGGTEVEITQIDNSGLTSGSAFPIGVTIQEYQATNGSDTVTCSFTITVLEYDGPVVLACNDTVNVSVDANCEAHLFADMILEGDQYGCYDDFIITVENYGSDTGWIVIVGLPINNCYTVTITDPDSGNSCWGTVCLEDKLAPQIICACPPGSTADSCTISCLDVDLLASGNIPPNLYPEVIENCGLFSLEIISLIVDDQGCGVGGITVTWVAVDSSGMSDTCIQEFNIEPLSIDSLVFPPNYEGDCGTSSHPGVTGWPQIQGIDLTDEAGLCNLFLGYWDKVLQDCGGGIKILRTWTVLDWCTLELVEATQIIKLSDDEGPILTCPSNITVGTDFWYCYANVSVPKPIAYDECSDVVSFNLTTSSGVVVQFGNNFVINGLELGTHVITWTVTDLCGNSSTCSFTITVADDVVPVANCDHHTVVSLTNDGPHGITLVPASVFDDGSYDNCGPVTFRARRMDSCIDFDWTTQGACEDDVPNGIVNSDDRGTSHNLCVPFACCDVPQIESRSTPIMIELEVTDAAGNKNYCMVEVEVQDKIAPFIECPPDITVSCDFWFHVEESTFKDVNHNGQLEEDPLSNVFGNMLDAAAYNDDESARQPIIIDDEGNTQFSQPHYWGVDGWADDNCEANLEVRVRVFNDCSGDDLPGNAPPGAVKLIERRFSAKDSENSIPATCTQRIWVIDFEPFYITDQNCNNNNPNDGVIWPCDLLITDCPDEFGDLGEPVIISDQCNLIGVTYEDTRFEIADGACFKILREWKVIDWCQYDPLTGYGLWSYTQVIKVHDETAPEFINCPAGPVTLCVADPGIRLPETNQAFLGENDPLSSSCSVHVTLQQIVRETCGEEVYYDVKLYLNNGTEFIQIKPRSTAPLNENKEAVLEFNTEESSIQSIRRNGIPYNSPWCGDYHRVLWSVEDGCGKWAHCEYLIRLEDCKQPSPVCIQGLSTVLMPIGCEVTLWAKDFNASSFDDCTASEALLYSFSGDSYQPSKVFNPENIALFGVELAIQIWVADGGTDDNCNGQIEWSERNKDFCTTTVVFTDNSNNCNIESIVYEGHILTEHSVAVELVNVSLQKDGETIYSMTTIENGRFVLAVPEEDGQKYQIVPKRNDNHRNGVSTLDLVRIQKHLLGRETFTSPYLYIAADANSSKSVSAIDLIEIRKLILGIYTEFPHSESWRFVNAHSEITDQSNPWPFEESITMLYDGSSHSDLDFVGVKVGDVNNTVEANATEIISRNSRRMLGVNAQADVSAETGGLVNVTLTIPQDLLGFQWTLETNGLEYVGVSSQDIQITDDHVGVLDNGVITMSWNRDEYDTQVEKKQVKVVLQFLATQPGNALDMIRMSSKITEAEAYATDGEIFDVKLENRTSVQVADFALYQNEPNPWNGTTMIRFDLPEAGKVKLSIFDLTGKMIRMIESDYTAGAHSIQLTKKDIATHGVLYYRLDSGNYSATKKMIHIE